MFCIGVAIPHMSVYNLLVPRPDLIIVTVQVAALPCMADDTVFALHLAHGTDIEVPDPDKNIKPDGTKRYRCHSDTS